MTDVIDRQHAHAAPRLVARPFPSNRIAVVGGIVSALVLLTMAGCQSWIGLLAPSCLVSGTVTWNGQAVTDSWVIFIPLFPEPVDNRLYPIAYGQTGETGRYQLRMSEEAIGAVPGSYMVVIQKRPQPSESENADGGVAGQQFEKIPSEFNRHSTLRAIVPNQPSAVIDFAL